MKCVLFIDSGIGGLTTLSETIKHLPSLNFIYFADDEYAPYGNKSILQLQTRITKIIDMFINKINMVVLACNTATACTIDYIRKKYHIPIVGTEPAIKMANNPKHKILLLATPATVSNRRIINLAKDCQSKVKFLALPNFATLVDDYYLNDSKIAYKKIINLIKDIGNISKHYSHIVLGCTHYIHFKSIFKQFASNCVLDGNYGVYKRINGLINSDNLSLYPTNIFCCSSNNKNVIKKYQKIFTETLAKI